MKLEDIRNMKASSLEKIKEINRYPIFTSYYAIKKEIKAPIKAISISIECPDINMKQITEVAPDKYTLNNFKKEALKNKQIAEERFKDIYRLRMKELLRNGELENLANKLTEYAKTKPVILFCYEKSEEFCHRHLLAKTLNKFFDLDIQELITPEMIIRKQKEFQKQEWEKFNKSKKDNSGSIEFINLF